MKVTTSTLDPWGLTVVEVIDQHGGRRHFVPFDDQRAKVFPVGQHHLFAVGRGYRTNIRVAAAIFDLRTLARTFDVRGGYGEPVRQFGWAQDPSSLVVAMSAHPKLASAVDDRPMPTDTRVLEASLAGDRVREFLVQDFACLHLLVDETGAIVMVGHHRVPHVAFAVVSIDPDTGSISVQRTADDQYWLDKAALNWFSPDGRYALRHHVGSIIRDSTSTLGRLIGRGAPAHPDVRPDGKVRYGHALDLYRLVPFRLERRIITRWSTEAELDVRLLRRMHGGISPTSSKLILEELARAQDYRKWDGASQILGRPIYHLEGEEREAADQRNQIAKGKIFERIKDVRWNISSDAFTVRFSDDRVRLVGLNGRIGPIHPIAKEQGGLLECVSSATYEAARKAMRERSRCLIPISDLGQDGIIDALDALKGRLDDNFDALVFRHAFVVAFQQGRRKVKLRALAEAMIGLSPPHAERVARSLEAVLATYAKQAIRHLATNHTHINDGDADNGREALSELARALAKIGHHDHMALRRWFETVDQEHDDFAAHHVFKAAIAHGWSAQVIRFGVWFAMTQWQTLRFDLLKIGMMEAARAVYSPQEFALLLIEEAEDFSIPRGFQNLENPAHDRLMEGARLLDVEHDWDRQVLQRMPPEILTAA